MRELREIAGEITDPGDPRPSDWDIASQAIFNVIMELTLDDEFNRLLRESESDAEVANYVGAWLDRLGDRLSNEAVPA